MGFAGTFLKKFPAPSKISLRPHIPCASGNRLLQCLRQQIQDLRFKINVIEIELAKEEKREPKIFELFTCHTLRHTYATRCYENGVDQQVVQKLLGHSTLAMTTDLYTHVSEEKKKEEVAELKILA